MLVKDLLEQTKESILIERSIQLTELPYDIVNTRASRRKAEKQLQKKYKKLIAAILRLDPVLSGEMITFDMDEGDFMKDAACKIHGLEKTLRHGYLLRWS